MSLFNTCLTRIKIRSYLNTCVSHAAVFQHILRRRRVEEAEVLRGGRRVRVRRWMRDGYRRFCPVTAAELVSHPQSLFPSVSLASQMVLAEAPADLQVGHKALVSR